MNEETLTLNLTIVLHDEPNLTAQDKETFIKQLIGYGVEGLAPNYDWGISVTGLLESTAEGSDDVIYEDIRPDYVALRDDE